MCREEEQRRKKSRSKICGQKKRTRTEKENKVNIWFEEKKESFCSIYLHPIYIFMTTEVEIIAQMHWLQIGRLYIPPQICDGCYEKELIGKRGEGR